MLDMYGGHLYCDRVREALLAVLAKEPGHGYELKQALETEFGEAWPAINIGQIYKTLSRLEADQLVTSSSVVQSGRPDKRVFALTAAGHEALRIWLHTPVDAPKVKGEFFTKLALASRGRLADPLVLIDHQRRAHLRHLRDLAELADRTRERASRLALEGAILHVQADLTWLERCEEAFGREQS